MRRYHTIAWVPVEVPAGRTIPLIILGDGCILYEAWRFLSCPANRSKSSSWHQKAASYLGLLYDYFHATESSPLTPSSADRLLSNFLSALDAGTIQPDGSDPTGLHWRPASSAVLSHARTIVREFCKYCDDLLGDENVLRQGRFAQSLERSLAREQRLERSKLYHLSFRRPSNAPDRAVRAIRAQKAKRVSVFPRDLLKPLIFEGCRRARKATDFGHPLPNQFNISLMLSIILLAGCGIRKSELFHIFADDVRLDEVRLYHPEIGFAAWKAQDGTLRKGTRQEYLATKFKLRPRSLLPKGDGNHSGWKNLLLDYGQPENYARLYWISNGLSKLFYQLHTIYITYVRPMGLSHPYYFVCQDHGNFGEPWTISAFDDAFDQALRKISEKQNRERGTNPHGLRHLYGQTLTDLGVRPIVIQHAMHHHSIESQMVYTRPSPEKITHALNAAIAYDPSKPPESITNEFEPYEWACDPMKLFAPWNLRAI